MDPVLKIAGKCNVRIKIPVEDIDGDTVRCRWSEKAKHECNGVCGPYSGFVLDEVNCIVTANVQTFGPYGLSFQLEDYNRQSISTPLSSVPLKFIVNVTNSKCVATTNETASVIKIHELTRPIKDACVGVKSGSLFSEQVFVYSTSKVTEITVQGPQGLIKSAIFTHQSNASLYYATISWTPSSDQQGFHLVSIKASNQAGVSTTEQYTYRIVVGGGSPLLINPFPNFQLEEQAFYSFTLKSSIPVRSANRSSFVEIFELEYNTLVDRIPSNSIQIEKTSIVKFKSNYKFKVNKVYYVLIDEGLVSSLEYCGVDSVKINSRNFWQFRILSQFNGHLTADYVEALGITPDMNEIDLSDKKITSIDLNAFNSNLTSLNLTSNNLTSFDCTRLKNLSKLYLENNKINSLNSCESLTELSLINNQISSLDFLNQFDFAKLECLYLTDNKLITLPLSLFNNMNRLKCLYLNRNNLTKIEKNIFSQLFSLNYLNLESNNIMKFNMDALLNLKNLKTVCLKRNPLIDLFPTSFKPVCSTSPECVPNIVDWCVL